MLEFMLSLGAMICTTGAALLLKMGVNNIHLSIKKYDIRAYARVFANAFKQPLFFLGGILLGAGWLLKFAAISLADLTYVRIINITHVIFLIMGCKIFLHEKITKFQVVSVSFTIAGLVLLFFGKPLTRNDTPNLIIMSIFVVTLLFSGVVLFITSIKSRKAQYLAIGLVSAIFYSLGQALQGFFAIEFINLSNINLSLLISLILNPILYVVMLFSLLGFFFHQASTYKFDLSIIYPINYGISEILVFIYSILVFGDKFSFTEDPFKVSGLILIIVGFISLMFFQKDYIFLNPHLNLKDLKDSGVLEK
ncbi:MAG: hypothetical protein ACTSXU_07980 [Promethearchaeota archaeon]